MTDQTPVISSIILNWNRADLLRTTLESYARTVDLPHELFIVDNGSTDDSPDVIRAFCATHPSATAIWMPENRGGEAINAALDRCTAPLVHLSENDIEYRPGWTGVVTTLFDVFPQLGQLSPFGPVPEDDEVWVAKSCVLRHARGHILYEAFVNLGTTCILRRSLVAGGLRVRNLESAGAFLLPDDIQLSADVKAAGYITAFAPHYLVHNRGHRADEFATRPDYYRENYRSKPVGEEGWQARIAEWRERPKPVRRSHVLPAEAVSPEKSAPTPECAEPWLWSMFDGWTAEVEVIEFLHALVRLLKPRFVLETGTWHGIAATAMGSALRDNGRGRLVSLEVDPESHAVASERIAAAGLQAQVELVRGASLEYVADETIDMALFDSELQLRGAEFKRFLPRLRDGAIVIFHDTNSAHQVVGATVADLVAAGDLDAIALPTPRGVTLCRVRDRATRGPS